MTERETTPESGGSGGEAARLQHIESAYSFWGRFPRLYAVQDLVTFMGRPGRVRGRAVERLRLREGDRVLEVGCGTGRNLPYLIEAIGSQGRLFGFDYSREMLAATDRLCRRRGWHDVTLLQGDAADLDVGEEGFDGVLSVLAMSVVPRYRQALERCHEVLRPGGVMSVCDARLFSGRLARLNPLLRAVYARWASWDPDRDLPGAMEEVFGNVEVETLNLGTFVVATSMKGGEG